MGFLGAAHLLMDGRWGQKAPPPQNLSHISYNHETLQLYLTQRRYKKYMNHETHPLSSADIAFFH